MNEHDWAEVLVAEWVSGPGSRETQVTWVCRRCGLSVTTERGTLAEVFGKDTDCDEELVRDVMEG
jgi:hypothetical protein